MKYSKKVLTLVISTLLFSCSKEEKKPAPPTTPSNPITPIDSVKDVGKVDSVKLTYQNKTVSYKTVVAKDGRVWLQQNLGSQRVAQTEEDEQSFGDVFQWGRWDDGHQLRSVLYKNAETTLIKNDPTGLNDTTIGFYKNWWRSGDENNEWSANSPSEVTPNKGCDPCKAIGAGWRMPTKEEWETVLTKEDINSVTSGFKSNLKIAGAGGGRNSLTGNFEGPGNAAFWTSTATGKKTSLGACAYDVTLLSYKYFFSEYPAYGTALTIRCIKSK